VMLTDSSGCDTSCTATSVGSTVVL
jgi:hypothetical protein